MKNKPIYQHKFEKSIINTYISQTPNSNSKLKHIMLINLTKIQLVMLSDIVEVVTL